MATNKQLRVFEKMFDQEDDEDRRDCEYFRVADVKNTIKVLDALTMCERGHDYTEKEWKLRKSSIVNKLKVLGLNKTLNWTKQDHLPSKKSYVCLSINSQHFTNSIICYLVYIAIISGSGCFLDKTANIWQYIPKEKKRIGIRR